MEGKTSTYNPYKDGTAFQEAIFYSGGSLYDEEYIYFGDKYCFLYPCTGLFRSYKKEYIQKCITNNEINYCSATYYLLSSASEMIS